MRLYLSSYGLGNEPAELARLLGGRRKTAIVLNAADHKTAAGRAEAYERERVDLEGLGLVVSELDLRRYFGNADGLKVELSKFDLLWVRGGNSFNLRRAFRQSGADDLLKTLLDHDQIVYGGYSAGPAVLAPDLRGLEFVDDPNAVPEGYDHPIVWEGLGVIPYALAPHYRSDHPESAQIEVLVQRFIDHHIPFKALRDGEAIVIDGGTDRIVGGRKQSSE